MAGGLASSTSPPLPSSSSSPSIVPAQLGFLAIYNPSLGTTDETIDDQIVYYASVNTQTARQRRRHRSKAARPTEALSREERNVRLRQIGLAQGMVEFGRSFAGGSPVDTIDTEKSRVVLHELEPGWWILASIDLTRLPLPPAKSGSASPQPPQPAAAAAAEEKVEYSSREVKPTALILRDLLRAHAVFLLHHASSLSALFVRNQRAKFISILGRYWDQFLSTWDVLLHGNPACNVFGGIKIAPGGELGIGVGEEERGSGEREVLEGLVERTEGLVDLIVGKFGEPDVAAGEKEPGKGKGTPAAEQKQWLGTGAEPGAEDGAIFLGVGALSRHSLRDMTCWMEDLYSWGENAYGVIDSPTATRLQPRKRRTSRKSSALKTPAIAQVKSNASSANEPAEDAAGGSSSKLFSYLKLGYGTAWSLGGSGPAPSEPQQQQHAPRTTSGTAADEPSAGPSPQQPPPNPSSGHFLVGLRGNVDESTVASDISDQTSQDLAGSDTADFNSRILVRTVTVELEAEASDRPESAVTKDLGSHDTELAGRGDTTDTASSHFDSQDRNKTKKLRVVVYVARPFIFILLFQLHTDSLAFDSFYRSLHLELASLHKSLLTSTAYRPEKPSLSDSGNDSSVSATAQIHDLIWDPRSLTVHSTIPNIPTPGSSTLPSQPAWSRIEALNTHNQILNMFMTTRDDPSGLERTCKTSRGWWIVWNRVVEQLPPRQVMSSSRTTSVSSYNSSNNNNNNNKLPNPISDTNLDKINSSDDDSEGDTAPARRQSFYDDDEDEQDSLRQIPPDLVVSKEIFLIRKASDHASGGLRSISGSSSAAATGASAWTDGASRLAQGIGVDTRRYIEGLLMLNR
ncbi:hypothetical protein B0T19DRAFT_158647 [Cercophora scortea]|uniref:CCZ1/INTU/HSP4 first Longin domain-containing protein n=1 Tax=Cercophora scortea TaxID=314031 RepID=A0AAE0MDQ1_9PEZI|nr:hypothetical protein B0T19DRAFT_158647 [Cercophora scortea]